MCAGGSSIADVPAWVSVLNALAVPMIGAVGGFIAWQQMKIARTKLQHDLFDRRFAVFAAARRFLRDIAREGRVPQESEVPYRVGIAEAAFLLDEATCQYLEEIWRHACLSVAHYKSLEGVPAGEERSRLVEAHMAEIKWLMEQLPVLVERFKPFLKL